MKKGKGVTTNKNPISNKSDEQLRREGKCTECAGNGIWTSFGTPGTWRWVGRCRKCGA